LPATGRRKKDGVAFPEMPRSANDGLRLALSSINYNTARDN
jgi:hypothetical protein